jgi:CheY-like chemotaxis protein
MRDLSGQRILIAEDDSLNARLLADHFRTAQARVLGPFPTLQEAECHAGQADLAVLDVSLRGQPVFRLADSLLRANVPFVFFSGFDLSAIPPRFADVPRLGDPFAGLARRDLAQSVLTDPAPTLDTLVPRLRLSARLIVPDALAADRLVEATLLLALQDELSLADVGSVATWLHTLMARALAERSTQLLN